MRRKGIVKLDDGTTYCLFRDDNDKYYIEDRLKGEMVLLTQDFINKNGDATVYLIRDDFVPKIQVQMWNSLRAKFDPFRREE